MILVRGRLVVFHSKFLPSEKLKNASLTSNPGGFPPHACFIEIERVVLRVFEEQQKQGTSHEQTREETTLLIAVLLLCM